jgi:hypothetical protein
MATTRSVYLPRSRPLPKRSSVYQPVPRRRDAAPPPAVRPETVPATVVRDPFPRAGDLLNVFLSFRPRRSEGWWSTHWEGVRLDRETSRATSLAGYATALTTLGRQTGELTVVGGSAVANAERLAWEAEMYRVARQRLAIEDQALRAELEARRARANYEKHLYERMIAEEMGRDEESPEGV